MINCKEIFSKILSIPVVKFILPFTIWILFFQKILLGQSPAFGDGFYHYVYVHYFVSNLRMGVFPLWNPFITLGMSQLFFNNFIGAFNPLWTLTLLLNLAGTRIYFAYVYSIFLYFFLGTLGFYLFAKLCFEKIRYAYLAFILLLFSGFGFPMLLDIKFLITFVPMIWFFYFCLLFHKEQKPFSLLGLSLSLMVGGISYFPPYWIAVLVITLFLTLIFFSKSFFLFFQNLWIFSKHHKIIFLICLLSVGASFISSIKTYAIAKNNEIIFSHRKGDSSALSPDGARVGLTKVKGLMMTMDHFHDDSLNTGPGRFSAPHPATFYLSLFVFILIFLGCLNKLTKAIFVKFLFCLILFFIIAVPNSPVVDFFYHYVFGFDLIQGTASLLPALMMGMILLAVAQGKEIVEKKFFIDKRLGFLFISLVHLAFVFYFLSLSEVSFFSYGSIAISLLFFFFLFFKNHQRVLLTLLLYIAVLLQPWEVTKRYAQSLYPGSDEIFKAISHEPTRPIFSYLRPRVSGPDLWLPREDLWYDDILMRDAPAVDTRDFSPRWTHMLLQDLPLPIAEEYVLNKFYLYDHIYATNSENLDFLDKVFKKRINTAIVHLDSIGPNNPSFLALRNILSPKIKKNTTEVEVVAGPRENFRVVDFNANSLKIQTNFERDRFLVYTSSYQSDWLAFINGGKKEIFRSNVAFKGIFIPKGFNEIVLIYAPLGGPKTYFATFILYNGILAWLVILMLIEKKDRRNKLNGSNQIK